MSRLLGLLMLLLLAACARPAQPIWTEVPSAESLLQHLAETTGQVNSLDAAATVGLTVKGKFFSSQQFLLIEKPDRIRADVLTGFGQLILQLATDGEQLAVFMNTSVPARFYRGAATTESLSRFTRMPLAARDMVRLLLYDPPLIGFEESTVSVEKKRLLLRLKNPDQQQELLFDERLRLVGCRYFAAGEAFLNVKYQKLAEKNWFPQTIRIEFTAQETSSSIKFSELQINAAIPSERFHLKTPEKIPVEALP